jgi:hypothetical protein
VLGLVLMVFDGRQQESVRSLKRALASAPADPDVLFWLAMAYANYAGRCEAALPLAERLVDIDPLNPLAVAVIGVVHFCDGRFGPAAEMFHRAFPVPRLPIERGWLGVALAYSGRDAEALALLEAPGRARARRLGSQACSPDTRCEAARPRPECSARVHGAGRRSHFSWQSPHCSPASPATPPRLAGERGEPRRVLLRYDPSWPRSAEPR